VEIKSKRLNDDEFVQEREKVLTSWPIGEKLDEAIDYRKSLPSGNIFSTMRYRYYLNSLRLRCTLCQRT
jgi:glutamate mutase epsilon subunit